MAKTATAQEIKISDEPKSLKAAMLIIELARTTIATLTEERDEAIERAEAAENDASESNARSDELEDEQNLDTDNIIELARIAQKLKAGRIAEAQGDLDRLLHICDCGGAAQMSAVAVML